MTAIIANGPVPAKRGRRRGALRASTLIAAGLAAVLAFLLLPAILLLLASMSSSGSMGGAGALTLDNYIRLFEQGFGRFMLNSLMVCIGATVVGTAISLYAAYAISRLNFPGRRSVIAVILSGQFFPWIVLVTPLFILFARAALSNSLVALAAAYAAVMVPFSVYLLLGYLATVPRSLDEAALMDGASRNDIIWRIIVPVTWPGLVATATYGFLQCWSEYLLALTLLTDESVKTIPLGLYQFFGDDRIDWGMVMAGSVAAIVPTLALFLPLQRLLVSGLTAGAVK